jgi:hypothetical protein
MNHRFTPGSQCIVAIAALVVMQGAFAQSAVEPSRAASESQLLGGPMRHDMLFLAGAQLERERVVQGAPYCADAVHESVQQLADGNRIVQRQASRQCRDAQGRTRQEVVLPNGHRNVFVRDPVAQEAWMLDVDTKQAVRLDALRRGPGEGAGPRVWDRVLGWSRDMRDKLWHRPDAPLPPPPPVAEVGPEPVRIAMGTSRMAELAPPPGMPPPLTLHARWLGPRGPGVVTLLPAEAVEGLRADARRTTWTIEAGRIGNEKPIVIVNEVWSSPELGITLRSRESDPLMGEDSFRVQNVARGEPEAALFRVPADFTKVSAPPLMMRGKP